MKDLVIQKSGKEAYNFFSQYVDVEAKTTLVISSTNNFNILNYKEDVNAIINLSKVNDIRFINKFFESVNSKLKLGDIFISRFETFTARQKRKKIGRVPVVRSIYFG